MRIALLVAVALVGCGEMDEMPASRPDATVALDAGEDAGAPPAIDAGEPDAGCAPRCVVACGAPDGCGGVCLSGSGCTHAGCVDGRRACDRGCLDAFSACTAGTAACNRRLHECQAACSQAQAGCCAVYRAEYPGDVCG
jgi:hypothetical protein